MDPPHYDQLRDLKSQEAKERLGQLDIPETPSEPELTKDFKRRATAQQTNSQERKLKAPAKPVQVPFWPEPVRVIPSELLRSALFSCARRTEFLDQTLLASWGDTQLTFTGARLTQFDETLWLQLIHLHRGQSVGPGLKIHVSARALMKDLGIKTAGGSGFKRLIKSLNRLMGAVVTLQRGSQTVMLANPVRRAAIDEATERFAVELNPDWMLLLKENATYLDWEVRKALPTGIATWMHRYILSHRATASHPHRIGLEQLRQLSGMLSSPKEFKRTLKRSMEKIQNEGIIEHWCFTEKAGALEFSRPQKIRRKKQLKSSPNNRR